MIGLIRLLTALAQAIPVLEGLMVKLMEAIKSARTRSRHARKDSQVDAAIADSLQRLRERDSGEQSKTDESS